MLTAIKKTAFRYFRKTETKHHELNYLFWECTTRCNLHCLHCGSDCSKDSQYPDMPLEDFLRAVDTLKNKSENFQVVITGGEALLRNDLEICGKEIRKRGMRWSLVTNGHLYTASRHKSLLSAGLGALTISLDGLEKSHNWLRNNPTSFAKVIEAIRLAASTPRINFDVVTCVNQQNIYELHTLRELLIGLNVKNWRLFTIIPIGRATHNPELLLSDNQFIVLMDFISESRKSNEIDVKFSCEGFVGEYESKVRDSYFFCRAGINIGSVLIDGSISACPNIDRSFSQGNIYRDNLQEVWDHGFAAFRDRNWMKKGTCANCNYFIDCQGNGFHNWHGDKNQVLVCHQAMVSGGKNENINKKNFQS